MNQENTIFDVIVIGGGPAGSTAATLLAKKGHRVAILEKEQHPRLAVGESLLPHFWKYADLLGVSDKIRAADFVIKKGGVMCWDGQMRAMSFSNFGYDQPALHVEREEFDEILFRNAEECGVITYENTKATKVETIGQEYRVTAYQNLESQNVLHLNSKYIIDATGQSCLLSKKENFHRLDEDFRFQAFWGYFEKMDFLSEIDVITKFEFRKEKKPYTLVVHSGDWGWIWQIIMKEKVSVGIILERSQLAIFKQKGNDLKSRFINTIKEDRILSRLMVDEEIIDDKIYSIKDYSYNSDSYTFQHTILTGDAAAFVDPVNSAGVLMAFYSGYFASWTIDRALRSPNKKDHYFNLYDGMIRARFKLFRSIAVPKKNLDSDLLQDASSTFKMLSKSELDLMVTQLSLSQRAENLPEFLSQLGLDHEKMFVEKNVQEFIGSL